jgi:hypothetical protein
MMAEQRGVFLLVENENGPMDRFDGNALAGFLIAEDPEVRISPVVALHDEEVTGFPSSPIPMEIHHHKVVFLQMAISHILKNEVDHFPRSLGVI